jgi:hypothetical protein
MILITSPNLSQLKIFHPAVAVHIHIMPSPAYSLSDDGFLRCPRLNDLRRCDMCPCRYQRPSAAGRVRGGRGGVRDVLSAESVPIGTLLMFSTVAADAKSLGHGGLQNPTSPFRPDRSSAFAHTMSCWSAMRRLPPSVFVLVFWYIDEKCQLIQSGISCFSALEMLSESGLPPWLQIRVIIWQHREEH